MLKQINPEDLKVGQECYIKVVTEKVKISDGSPVLRDIAGNFYYPSRGEPIYTADNDRLKMVVEVASRLLIADTHYSALEIESELGHNLSEDSQERSKQWASAYKRLVAREAIELITACENELNKQP